MVEHEELVEVDFQRFYGLDYRDRYRPGGGASRLTFRRMLLLVEYLPRESFFKSACDGRPARSFTDERLMDIPEALTGKPHPVRGAEQAHERLVDQAPARERALAVIAEREKKYGKPKI